MARRLPKEGDTKAPSSAAHKAADDLSVLKPDITLPIAGREVTFREYGFFDGLEAAHRAQGFIEAMAATIADGELRYDRVRRLFGVHQDSVVAIAAVSAGVEPEWIRALKSADAEVFMSTWFAVNAGFFVHEAVVSLRERGQGVRPAGRMSSPASPAPGSETPTASAAAPSVS